MSENEKTPTAKIVLDKYFWIEPDKTGWALRFEKINDDKVSHLSPDKNYTTSKNVWYHGNLASCIASYIDKKLHNKLSTEEEDYTKEEVLTEIQVLIKGMEKRFGYLRGLSTESNP